MCSPDLNNPIKMAKQHTKDAVNLNKPGFRLPFSQLRDKASTDFDRLTGNDYIDAQNDVLKQQERGNSTLLTKRKNKSLLGGSQ